MTVAELRRLLADLSGDATVEVIHGVHGSGTELVECEPVVLVSLQDGRGYAVITTEREYHAVEEEYGFMPRRKHSE